MKQETKEIIDWIKKQINLAKENCIDIAWNGKHEYYNADYEKAMEFLDSLPQIESRLCQGGYIQDCNGTPCCNGDEVVFTYWDDNVTNIPKKKDVLRWSPYHQFIIIVEHKVSSKEHKYLDEYTFDDILEFEKVQ
jgi:hypothetical protein